MRKPQCEQYPKYKEIESADELEFAIFCVEAVAVRLGITGAEAYRALTGGSDILHSYIVPLYDILHTQGREYIADDLIDVMRDRGELA